MLSDNKTPTESETIFRQNWHKARRPLILVDYFLLQKWVKGNPPFFLVKIFRKKKERKVSTEKQRNERLKIVSTWADAMRLNLEMVKMDNNGQKLNEDQNWTEDEKNLEMNRNKKKTWMSNDEGKYLKPSTFCYFTFNFIVARWPPRGMKGWDELRL